MVTVPKASKGEQQAGWSDAGCSGRPGRAKRAEEAGRLRQELGQVQAARPGYAPTIRKTDAIGAAANFQSSRFGVCAVLCYVCCAVQLLVI